ncbi:hypothetical protein [Winogradskyella sp.]|uniref:hypothetical protein n=1 Tax=Winogradskyella sp. TaxID=1883156 RepID=UPI003BA9E046
MRQIILSTLICLLAFSCKQDKEISKKEYLNNNNYDLNLEEFEFPQQGFKIIGFGAYHGSAKTEDIELKLIQSLTKQNAIKYYLPETDFSIAHYFDYYLNTGDTLLLKDLVTTYGSRVPQDRSIETYNKWKQLRTINEALPRDKKLKVLGIDLLVSYKYTSKHILELIDSKTSLSQAHENLKHMVSMDTTDYSIGYESYSKRVFREFVADFEQNKKLFYDAIAKKEDFNHIIANIKVTFRDFRKDREPTIYSNYIALKKRFSFELNPQFMRMGFSHLMKSREGKKGYSYFFNRLIENNIYDKNTIVSVIGYLTKSHVVWDEIYDDNGKYTGYTTEGGYGIGDYEKEYFRGIVNLKDTKLSDKTLYRLNGKDSPYFQKEPDLIEVIMTDEPSNGEAVRGMSTLDFIDYAILISDSKASRPIYEME